MFNKRLLNWIPRMSGVLVLLTQNRRLGSLNYKHFYSYEARQSKIKMLAHSVLGEGPVPGLQMVIFLLCPHLEKTERLSSLPFLIGALITSWGSTLMTSSSPNCFPKAPSPNNITLKPVASTQEYRGPKHSVHSKLPYWYSTTSFNVPFVYLQGNKENQFNF